MTTVSDTLAAPGDSPPPRVEKKESVQRTPPTIGARFAATLAIFRAFFFVAYLVVAFVAFWVWLAFVVVLFLRLLVYFVTRTLLWLAGGAPRPEHSPRQKYAQLAVIGAPLLLQQLTVRESILRFRDWNPGRQFLTVLFILVFIGVPLAYVIPRPNYVQVINTNALHEEPDGTDTYVIHAVDLFDPGDPQEYANKRAWWLLKFDPQRTKSRMFPGRYYRIWVVGLRWFFPSLFPNIVGVTEVDRRGRPLPEPSYFIPNPDGR